MYRQPYGPRLIEDRPGDPLTYPPGRIGAELGALSRLVPVGRLHESDIAFLDQVEQGKSPVHILFRDRDHKPQIGLDELILGLLGLFLLRLDPANHVPDGLFVHPETISLSADAALQLLAHKEKLLDQLFDLTVGQAHLVDRGCRACHIPPCHLPLEAVVTPHEVGLIGLSPLAGITENVLRLHQTLLYIDAQREHARYGKRGVQGDLLKRGLSLLKRTDILLLLLDLEHGEPAYVLEIGVNKVGPSYFLGSFRHLNRSRFLFFLLVLGKLIGKVFQNILRHAFWIACLFL